MIASVVVTALNIPYLVAWIGTLINLARIRDSGWLILTILAGPIGVLIYLFAGPTPTARQTGPDPQYARPYSFSQAPSPQAPSPYTSSALAILQERFARGEIEASTFAAMSEQPKASEHPLSGASGMSMVK
jgi:hypothetical protein